MVPAAAACCPKRLRCPRRPCRRRLRRRYPHAPALLPPVPAPLPARRCGRSAAAGGALPAPEPRFDRRHGCAARARKHRPARHRRRSRQRQPDGQHAQPRAAPFTLRPLEPRHRPPRPSPIPRLVPTHATCGSPAGLVAATRLTVRAMSLLVHDVSPGMSSSCSAACDTVRNTCSGCATSTRPRRRASATRSGSPRRRDRRAWTRAMPGSRTSHCLRGRTRSCRASRRDG